MPPAFQGALSAPIRAPNICPKLPYSHEWLHTFELTDANYPAKSYAIRAVKTLDGSSCEPRTRDGTAMSMIDSSEGPQRAQKCVDFGVSNSKVGVQQFKTGADAMAHAAAQPHPLEFFPPLDAKIPTGTTELANTLRQKLERQQFPSANGCGVPGAAPWDAMYYVHLVPQLGFGSVIEYAMMFLARATHMGSQLSLGKHSAPVWTSPWACGKERSLTCYFNVSSCCGAYILDGRPLELPRRRNPLNLGLPGFDTFGAAWLAGQLANFFFSRMTDATRKAIDQRRAPVWPRIGSGVGGNTPGSTKCIGMHIRGGDACHARRFCPSNLTSTFFAQAMRMRKLYGVRTIVLATDSTKAATFCKSGGAARLGFECKTMATMDRDKFDSPTFIEQRVGQHEQGKLSGSTVALDALADIDMLADCDHHILVLRSAISRLAYALSLARHGKPTPLVSMQWPYSPGFMKSALKMKKGMRLSKAGEVMNAKAQRRAMKAAFIQ